MAKFDYGEDLRNDNNKSAYPDGAFTCGETLALRFTLG